MLHQHHLGADYLAACARGDVVEEDRLCALIDADGARERDETTSRLASPAALRDASMFYASRGLAVFPLRPGTKTPLTRHGLYDASTDPTQITTWWTTTPQANIGLPTGGTFDVVDLDGTDGLRSWLAIVDTPAVLARVRTARAGGWHHYVAPTGRGNRAGMAPGLDFRSTGGYVVAPPSRIGERLYRWVDVPHFLGGTT